MVEPTNAKQLTRLMLQDSEFKQAYYNLVAEADQMLNTRGLAAVREFLKRNKISLQLLSHRDTGEALSRFFKEARVAGEHVRMY